MSLGEFVLGGGGAVALVLTLLQIAPIKIDPWTWVARAIGKAINHDIEVGMMSEIRAIDEKVMEIQRHQEEYEKKKEAEKMDACRSRILRFGDECRQDVRHSKEFFDQILRDITTYERYCRAHEEYENSLAVLTIENIKRIYSNCVSDDDFL